MSSDLVGSHAPRALSCEFDGCSFKTYADHELEAHQEEAHPLGCDHDGCWFTAASARGLEIHEGHMHSGDVEESDPAPELETCNVEGCDYESNPHGVAIHKAKAHSADEDEAEAEDIATGADTAVLFDLSELPELVRPPTPSEPSESSEPSDPSESSKPSEPSEKVSIAVTIGSHRSKVHFPRPDADDPADPEGLLCSRVKEGTTVLRKEPSILGARETCRECYKSIKRAGLSDYLAIIERYEFYPRNFGDAGMVFVVSNAQKGSPPVHFAEPDADAPITPGDLLCHRVRHDSNLREKDPATIGDREVCHNCYQTITERELTAYDATVKGHGFLPGYTPSPPADADGSADTEETAETAKTSETAERSAPDSERVTVPNDDDLPDPPSLPPGVSIDDVHAAVDSTQYLHETAAEIGCSTNDTRAITFALGRYGDLKEGSA